jgi:hypothetical protein
MIRRAVGEIVFAVAAEHVREHFTPNPELSHPPTIPGSLSNRVRTRCFLRRRR